MKKFVVPMLLMFSYGCIHSARAMDPASQTTLMYMSPMFGDQVVGDTKDACDGHELVKLEGTNGEVKVAHSSNNVPVVLPSMTREIYWYCGGSRERSANDKPFNKVLVTRASNGAIHWVFVVETGAATSNEPIHTGDTKDACDAKEPVKLLGTVSPVTVNAGEIKTAEMPALTQEIFWKCGNSNERSANPVAFNRVQVERAGNGAIQWVFYRTQNLNSNLGALMSNAQGNDLGAFIHNSQGNMFIDAPQLPPAQQHRTVALKQQLDSNWDGQRTALTTQLLAFVKSAQLPIENVQVALSNSSQSELRLEENPQAITMKYVVHENHATGTKSGGSVSIAFDVEAVLSLPRSGTVAALHADKVTVFVRHAEIEGNNFLGDVVVGALKSRIRAAETDIDAVSQNVPQLAAIFNAQIDQLRSSVPEPNLVTLNLSLDNLGNIRACATLGAAQCTFPPAVGRPVVPRVLDTSNDQCGQQKIWLWDSELGHYVSVSKGQSNVLVRVDDKRFDWFCGDDSEPDPSPSNQESASGPDGTFQVIASRDGGRGIHWEFLSWH